MNIAGMKQTAKRLISENGNDAILTSYVKSDEYDSTLGDYPLIPTDHNVKLAFINFESSEVIDGVTNFTDQQCYVDSDLNVDKTWTVTYNNIVHKIVHIRRTTAKNLITHYQLWLRA